MGILDLKSLFQEYCETRNEAKNKQLFGMEYENFILVPKYDNKDLIFQPLSVDGKPGVFSVLNNLFELSKYTNDPMEKVFEKGMLLSLKSVSGSKITIEPGGQIELSDAPRNSLLETNNSLQSYLNLLKKAVETFNGRLFFQGAQPLAPLEKIPFFPKTRYRIMFPYMLKTGNLGQWMMKASSGIQISIDYSSMEDLQRKFIFLNRLSPFLTALFANSPIVEGYPSGYLSYRSHIWTQTDNKRSGLQEEFLKESFRIEDYINWALNASPYHLIRNGRDIETTNWTFRELLNGNHPDLSITIKDWEEHLGMLFPDIRIKNILEVRVIDSITPKFSMAVPSLIGALLYNQSVFSSIQSILMDLPIDEFKIYKKAVAKEALHAVVNRTNFMKIGRLIVEKSLEGLGSEEEKWLLPFFDHFTKDGFCPADKTLKLFMECGANSKKWIKKILDEENH